MNKTQSEIGNIFTLKFLDFKREYMDDMKMILSNGVSDKVAPIIRECNDSLLDKTKLMVSEIIPKNQENLHKSIDSSLTQLQNSINNDTNLLMKSSLTKDVLEKLYKFDRRKICKYLIKFSKFVEFYYFIY